MKGNQDVDSTRGTYFAGRAAMMFWSPFLLDGMAGLRKDTTPSCPQCKQHPRVPGQEHGLVGPLPARRRASQFGSVSTFNIAWTRKDEAAQALLEFMMNDGYVRWLGSRRRASTPSARATADPEKTKAWAELESGVDTKAPLSRYSPTSRSPRSARGSTASSAGASPRARARSSAP